MDETGPKEPTKILFPGDENAEKLPEKISADNHVHFVSKLRPQLLRALTEGRDIIFSRAPENREIDPNTEQPTEMTSNEDRRSILITATSRAEQTMLPGQRTASSDRIQAFLQKINEELEPRPIRVEINLRGNCDHRQNTEHTGDQDRRTDTPPEDIHELAELIARRIIDQDLSGPALAPLDSRNKNDIEVVINVAPQFTKLDYDDEDIRAAVIKELETQSQDGGLDVEHQPRNVKIQIVPQGKIRIRKIVERYINRKLGRV